MDTGLFVFEEFTMAKTRGAYPPEFRRQMVELVHAGRVKSLGTVTPISRPIATPLRFDIAPFEYLLEGWCRSCG